MGELYVMHVMPWTLIWGTHVQVVICTMDTCGTSMDACIA